MSFLDRVLAAKSLVISVPEHVEKLTLIVEQKAQAAREAATAAEQAAAREAEAIKNAVTPELMSAWTDIEAALQHLPHLADLVKAHEAAPPAPAAPVAAAPEPAPGVL